VGPPQDLLALRRLLDAAHMIYNVKANGS